MAINQLTTANTFEQWLSATQNLIATANTLTDGNGATFVANTKLDVSGTGSTLNVRTSGSINVLYSNTSLSLHFVHFLSKYLPVYSKIRFS